MPDSGLVEFFADYAVSLGYDGLPSEVVHEVKKRLLDTLGCAMGAYRSVPAQIARDLAQTVTCSNGATVIGTAHRSSPEYAAFANGVLFRYLDYNDTYLSLEPAHPSDNFAAILTAGEMSGASGRDLIVAAALAYEIQCRLCDAASIRAHGWDHVTYGSFSTSLAAAKLMGLTREQSVHAMALAGTPNNAMRQTRVGMLSHWKGCAFANASRNGVFAAMLAARGMTGPSEVFEGEMGFWKQVSGPFTITEMGGNGKPFMINKTYIKFHPAEYHSQSAIDAAIALRKEIRDADEIQKVTIETFNAAVEIIGGEPEKWRPTTRETADHSLPYCTAVALIDGKVTLDSFDDAHLSDPKLLSLVKRTEVIATEDLEAQYPEGIPNRIRVQMQTGASLKTEITFPRGHARNPMTDDEVETKFRSMAVSVLGASKADEVIRWCWRLDEQPDLSGLLALMVVKG